MPSVIICLGCLLLAAGLVASDANAPVLVADPTLGTAIDGLALGWQRVDATHVIVSFRNTGEASVYLNLGLDLGGTPTFATLRIAVANERGSTRIGYLVQPASYIGPFTPMVVPVLPHGRYSFTLPFNLSALLGGSDGAPAPAPAAYSVSLIYDGSSMRHRDPTGEKVVSHASLVSNSLVVSAAIERFSQLSDVKSWQSKAGAGEGLWSHW